MRRVWLAAGLGAAVLVAGLVYTVTRNASPVAYSNQLAPNYGLPLLAGRTACQDHEYVPPDARKLGLLMQTGPRGGHIVATVRSGGRVVLRGQTAKPFFTGPVTVPVSGSSGEVRDAVICVRNAGRTGLQALGSTVPPQAARANALFNRARSNASATIDGRVPAVPERMVLAWYRKPESWVSFAGVIALRDSLFRASFVGTWTFWLVLVAVLAAGAGAVVLAARQVRA